MVNRDDRDDRDKGEKRGKVVVPYIRGVSENMARIFKRYHIETVHKPTTTMKNLLCKKMKDKIEKLDKTGAVYYNRCKKHTKSNYVGETEYLEKDYTNRIIDHKTSTRAASIEHTQERDEREQEQSGVRRGRRTMKKRNYKTMHEGTNQLLTEGNTVLSTCCKR